MKKYKEFISEQLDTQTFLEVYNGVTEELEKFWQDLNEKLEIEEFEDINNRNKQQVFEFNEKIRAERQAKKQQGDVQKQEVQKQEAPKQEAPKQEVSKEENKSITLDPNVLRRLRRENSDKLVNYLYDSKYKDYVDQINKILNGRFLSYTTDQLLDKLRKPLYKDKVDEIKNILKKRQETKKTI